MMAEESNGLQESAVSERYTFKMIGPSFSDMREQNRFTDAVITSDSGLEWNVHKVVMSRLGMFVYNSFSFPSFNGTLNMAVSDEVVQCIIDLAYKGKCDIHHENVFETLETALMYQLESLIKLCIAFILGNMMTVEHVISVKTCLSRVCQDGLKEMTDGALTEVVDKWIRRNFNDICKTKDIYELSSEELENYIKHDDLNMPEEDLLEFLLNYAKTEKLNSEKTIQLLANVRQSLIDISKLSQIVNKNQELNSEIQQSKEKQNLNNPRYPRDIVIIYHDYEDSAMQIFNVRKNEWKIIENQLTIDDPVCPVSLGNILYYFGDFEYDPNWIYWMEVKGLDIKSGRSVEIAKLHFPDPVAWNSTVTAVAWNGGIVAFVGSNVGAFYDPNQDKWSKFPTLKTARFATASLVVLDGIMFAIGGENEEEEEERISSIEYYDSENSEWTLCGYLNKIRGRNTAAAVDGKVYVFGETWEGELDSDGECFQPVLENGRMILTWLPSLKTPWTRRAREKINVSVIDDKLLFTGGGELDETDEETDEFINGGRSDIFSTKTGEWSLTSNNCLGYMQAGKCRAVTINTSDLEVDRIEELCSGKLIVQQT